MWRILSIALVGGAVWAVSLVLPATDSERQLQDVMDIAASGISEPAATGGQAPAIATAFMPAPAASAQAGQTAGAEPAAPQSSAATLAVAIEPGAALAPAALGEPSQGTAVVSRTDLVLKMQRELRRVGCYRGRLNGTWNPATRRAMARFNDKVEADLPLEEPDAILLTLLEKYDNRACGEPCAVGSAPDEHGQCRQPEVVAANSTPAQSGAALATGQPAPAGTLAPAPRKARPAPIGQGQAPQAPTAFTTDTGWGASVVAMVPSNQPAAPADAGQSLGGLTQITSESTTPTKVQGSGRKSKKARKTSGWGSGAYGLLGSPATKSYNATARRVNGLLVGSRRFVAAPAPSSGAKKTVRRAMATSIAGRQIARFGSLR